MPLDIPKIKKLMGDKSQAEIAARVGRPQSWLGKILGGGNVTMGTVDELARALKVRAKDLV